MVGPAGGMEGEPTEMVMNAWLEAAESFHADADMKMARLTSLLDRLQTLRDEEGGGGFRSN